MKNHWLRHKEYRECKKHNFTYRPNEPILNHGHAEYVMTFDKALSPEEIKQLHSEEIVIRGDVLMEGNVIIVGDLTVDGNLTITDCVGACSEQDVSVIDCVSMNMSNRIIADMMVEEDQKFMESIA